MGAVLQFSSQLEAIVCGDCDIEFIHRFCMSLWGEAEKEIAAAVASEREACAVIADAERGEAVTCILCGLRKAPRGRSVAPEMANSLCDHECSDYYNPPRPGDLWPGETRGDFGFGGFAAAIRARGGK